jgi:hypothetical protein
VVESEVIFILRKYGKQLGVIGFDWMGEKNPNEVFRNELIAAFQYFGTYILKKRGGIGLGGAHTIITLSQEEGNFYYSQMKVLAST